MATNTLTKGIEVVEHIKTDLDLLWKECFDSELGFTVEQMEFISSQINEIKRTIVSRVELPVMQKIAGIRWEQRYSTTLEDDKMGRWMRIGRINGMTVAIILKAKERFIVKLPNNKGDESLENAIIAMSEQDAMLEAEKYIAKYVSNFSA